MDTPETELVRRSLDGDQTAFNRLYRTHQSRIFSALYFRTRSREDAEDLLQTTFLRAYQGLSGFRGESAFSTWLMQIAMNVCTTHHRSEQARRLRADAVYHGVDSLRGIWEPASDPDPEETACRNQRRDVVEAGIRSLPYPYRDVTELRYLEDLTYNEITQAMDVPVGTVKTWLFRARQQLRTMLEETDVTAM